MIRRACILLWQAKVRAVQALTGEEGAATAEYALILALVVVMLITTLQLLGQTLEGRLQEIITQLQGS